MTSHRIVFFYYFYFWFFNAAYIPNESFRFDNKLPQNENQQFGGGFVFSHKIKTQTLNIHTAQSNFFLLFIYFNCTCELCVCQNISCYKNVRWTQKLKKKKCESNIKPLCGELYRQSQAQPQPQRKSKWTHKHYSCVCLSFIFHSIE